MTPTVFIQFLQKFVAAPSVTVFFHLRPLSTPSVPAADRYTIDRTVIPNCFRLTIRHGYTDEVVTEDLAMLIYEQLREFTIREGTRTNLPPPPPPPPPAAPSGGNHNTSAPYDDEREAKNPTSSSISSDTHDSGCVTTNLTSLQKAYETQVVYIVGKEQMRIRAKTRIWRRVALGAFLWLRDNTRSKMASLNIPVEKLVEVGFVKEV